MQSGRTLSAQKNPRVQQLALASRRRQAFPAQPEKQARSNDSLHNMKSVILPVIPHTR